MQIKPNVIYSLNQARKNTENVLEAFATDADWLFQPCPNSNHALWIIGHLGLADNMFAARAQGQDPDPPKGYESMFWFGSTPESDPGRYPAVDEVRAFFRDRRENLMRVVEDLSEEFLLSPTPSEGMFAEAPNMAQMLFFTAYHEGMHFGQLSVCHRGLGNDPIYKPAAATTES